MPAEFPDYPAAHSMDSEWFAVDKDGRVAVFETGESGPVPAADIVAAVWQGEDKDGLTDAIRSLPECEVLFDPAGLTASGRPSEDGPHLDKQYGQTLCWLRLSPPVVIAVPAVPVTASPTEPERPDAAADATLRFTAAMQALRDAVKAGTAVMVQGVGGPAAVLKWKTDDLFQKVHDGGLCRCCVATFDALPFGAPDDSGEIQMSDLSRHGLYRYSMCEFPEGADYGPYVRSRVPTDPVTLAALPPALRERLKRGLVLSNLSFADTAAIQPIELGPCQFWGDDGNFTYIASDGRIVRVGNPEPR